MVKKEKLMLLDANAIIHRSFHALPPLVSPKGEQVNAVYGFAATLLKAIEDESPDYLVACYDLGKETFRNKLYPKYKAHRKETDQSLYSQIPRTREILESLLIPIFAHQDLEADDLIGSLVSLAKRQGIEVVIVTGDNDALQLVDDSVSVYSLRRGVSDTLKYDPAQVIEKLKIAPSQVVDFKALAGDASDNIPGAPKVGPKTAVELLNKYRSLDQIYLNLEELPERLRAILTENRELVYLSRQLSAIRTDVEIKLDLTKAAVANLDLGRALALFNELGFRSLINRLAGAKSAKQNMLFGEDATNKITPQLPFEAVSSIERWREVRATLLSQDYLVIDSETEDLNGDLIGLAFAWGERDSVYLPLSPIYPGGLDLDEIRDDLTEILAAPKIRKIGHNIKFDLHVLDRAGFEVANIWFDTMIASGLSQSGLHSHSLDELSLNLLNFKKIPIRQLLGADKNAKMTAVPIDDLAAYACEDALITWRLYRHLLKDIEDPALKRIFYQIEMPLVPILFTMEKTGIKIDRDYLLDLSKKLSSRINQIKDTAYSLIGREINLASPTQLKELLFNELNLSIKGIKKTKTGLSTDIETLIKLEDAHPIIPLILRFRELSKLHSTYVETLPALADQNGRVHSSFLQLGAITGRMSSVNPNLQNIPKRTEIGNEVRRAFVAESGKKLLSADYSQIELRLVAHLSQDEDLIRAFNDGADFHSAVADQLKIDRRTAKAINFGIIYGLGPQGLANDLAISPQEAKDHIDRYFGRFVGVARYIERMKRFARENGYVKTIFGRRRYLPDILSPNPMLRSSAERMAINMPAQGSVADMVKRAMILIKSDPPPDGELLIQIHDELLFEVADREIGRWASYAKEKMTQAIELSVPLVVDLEIGPNWAEMERYR